MFRKLQWELTISYILVILFSMGILGFYLLESLDRYFTRELQGELYQQAQLVAEVWPKNVDLSDLTVREVRYYRDIIQRLSWQTGSRIRILNDRGVPVLDTGGENELDLTIRQEVKSAFSGIPMSSPVRKESGEVAGYLSQSYPIKDNYIAQQGKSEEKVTGVVYITRSTTYLNSGLNYHRNLFFIGFVISLILSMLLALIFSHTITRPIVEITRTADSMAKGDLTRRAKVNTDNEIGVLSDKFNIMAEKLQGTLMQLTEEKNKMSAIIKNLGAGVIAVDTGGRIVMINKTAFLLLGLKQQQVLGEKIARILPGHSILLLIEDADYKYEIHRELEGFSMDIAVDGYITPLFSDEGQSLGAVVILNDITEFKRLDKMRAEFVSNVSHELKTPLASIKGLAELLLDGALKEPQAEEFLNTIDKEVDRLTRLVKDLLDLSKMESGMVKMKKGEVDLRELILTVMKRMRVQAERKSIAIKESLEEGIPALANGDRVQQVLINLLDNAIRYTPKKGEIFIRLNRKDDFCLVEVEDTGPGISPEDMARVFERFFRADKSRTRHGGGFGLGLAISRQIIENLGGQIGVRSTVNRGTTFFFTLPLIEIEK